MEKTESTEKKTESTEKLGKEDESIEKDVTDELEKISSSILSKMKDQEKMNIEPKEDKEGEESDKMDIELKNLGLVDFSEEEVGKITEKDEVFDKEFNEAMSYLDKIGEDIAFEEGRDDITKDLYEDEQQETKIALLESEIEKQNKTISDLKIEIGKLREESGYKEKYNNLLSIFEKNEKEARNMKNEMLRLADELKRADELREERQKKSTGKKKRKNDRRNAVPYMMKFDLGELRAPGFVTYPELPPEKNKINVFVYCDDNVKDYSAYIFNEINTGNNVAYIPNYIQSGLYSSFRELVVFQLLSLNNPKEMVDYLNGKISKVASKTERIIVVLLFFSENGQENVKEDPDLLNQITTYLKTKHSVVDRVIGIDLTKSRALMKKAIGALSEWIVFHSKFQ